MSRGLVPLVWHPEDGTRGFSPESSPAFPRRSREDRQTQRASATCNTWDGPGWRKCKHKETISAMSNSDTWLCGQEVQNKPTVPSPLLLHTSRVSITIFPRALRDTFCRKRWTATTIKMKNKYQVTVHVLCLYQVKVENNNNDKNYSQMYSLAHWPYKWWMTREKGGTVVQ